MRPSIRNPRSLLLALCLAMATAPSLAAELTAEQIIEKALKKGTVGFKQGQADVTMTIVNPKGQKKQRTLQIKAMRGKDKLLKSMVKFIKPAEVAGISFLVLEKKDSLPDQYVYVPAAKVVRRVAAGNATSSFFGSDFTFADFMPLPEKEADKVKTTRKADAKVGGQDAYVLEAKIDTEGSPYSKVTTYVHKKYWIPIKIEFFDPQGKALKTLSVKKMKKMKGEIVPTSMKMKNVQKGSYTVLDLANIKPDVKLKESDFTEEAMQR